MEKINLPTSNNNNLEPKEKTFNKLQRIQNLSMMKLWLNGKSISPRRQRRHLKRLTAKRKREILN